MQGELTGKPLMIRYFLGTPISFQGTISPQLHGGNLPGSPDFWLTLRTSPQGELTLPVSSSCVVPAWDSGCQMDEIC
jgi:hypothetical protein